MLGTLRGLRPGTSSRPSALEKAAAEALAGSDKGIAKYRPGWALKKVRLRVACEGWPAGTVGVVIEPFEDAALVEISGELGVTLAEISAPYESLQVMRKPKPSTLKATPNKLVDKPSDAHRPVQRA